MQKQSLVSSVLSVIGAMAAVASIAALIWQDAGEVWITLAVVGWMLAAALYYAHARDQREIEELKEQLSEARTDFKEMQRTSEEFAASAEASAEASSALTKVLSDRLPTIDRAALVRRKEPKEGEE